MASNAPSSSNPTSTPDTPPTVVKYNGTDPILHGAAIVVSIVSPIGLLLPGRGRGRLSLQNLFLGGTAFWGLNQLAFDYTGKSITSRSFDRWSGMLEGMAGSVNALPTEAARRNSLRMEEERRKKREVELGVMGEVERREEERKMRERRGERGLVERLWMGGEEEGWKEKRMREEREALEGGKGYWDLIVGQVKEVWNGEGKGGEKKGGVEEGKK